MSFDPNNPTALIKDGLVFAAVAKVFQYASDKAADFVSGMPENEDDYYEDEEYE
ncbi:MAG: hypothetical protein ACTSQ0_06225 [Candidatus Heimdallarchaeota archaeon]